MNTFHTKTDYQKSKNLQQSVRLDFSIKHNKTILYCNKLSNKVYTPIIDIIKDDMGYVVAFYSNIFNDKDRVVSVKTENLISAIIHLQKEWYKLTKEQVTFKLNLPIFNEKDRYFTTYKQQADKTINFATDLSIMINVSEPDIDYKRNLFISWQEGTCTIEKNCIVDDNISEIIGQLYSFSKTNINDVFNFVILNKN